MRNMVEADGSALACCGDNREAWVAPLVSRGLRVERRPKIIVTDR
jgi:hypothetical protein